MHAPMHDTCMSFHELHDTCMSFHESGVEQLKRFTETQRGELLTPWRNKLGEVAPNVDTKCFDMSGEPLLIVHTAGVRSARAPTKREALACLGGREGGRGAC